MDVGEPEGGKTPGTPSFRLTVAVFALLFAAGIAVGYFFYKGGFSLLSGGNRAANQSQTDGANTLLSLYFPVGDHLQFENREAGGAVSRMALAAATIREFLKGPMGKVQSHIPSDTRLLGIYPGDDGILYIDLSDEFSRNFDGDALSEFLLLKGLNETVLANVYGIDGVKVLIEGKEAESLGGHISLLSPLGETVSRPMEENEYK
jgi:spore germination protein GerM